MSPVDVEGVSFVVPVLNGERWLAQCLDGILGQSDGRPMEVVVVDDGSVDASLAIVENYLTHRQVRLVHGPCRGTASALNAGIRAAVHPIICQVDQDVFLEPGWMVRLTQSLEMTQDPEGPQVAAAQGYYYTSKAASLWARMAGFDLEQRYRAIGGPYVNHVCTGNSAYRAHALHQVGLFDESLGYGYDNDMSYRLAEAGYRLIFNREARSLHCWRETATGYLVQQYGLGYGRLDLVEKHRRRVRGDDVAGLSVILHVPFMALGLLSLVMAGVALVGGGRWQFPAAFAALFVGTLAVERLVAGVRSAVYFQDPAGLFFAVAHLLRDLVWVMASLVWVGRRLGGRGRDPCYSMFRLAPQTPSSRSSESEKGSLPGSKKPKNVAVSGQFLALVPAYNEAANLPRVIAELKGSWPEARILVVDDASTDETPQLLPSLGVDWLRLSIHVGVGCAVRAGLNYACQTGHDLVVRVDGDGQHLATEIGNLLRALEQESCDAVFGSRYRGSCGYRATGIRRLGQRLLATLLSRIVGRLITDPTSGAWAFGPRAVKILGSHHPTGIPEPELHLFLHKNGLRVVEVPIEMRRRLAGQTSLTLTRELPALASVPLSMLVVPLRSPVGVAKP